MKQCAEIVISAAVLIAKLVLTACSRAGGLQPCCLLAGVWAGEHATMLVEVYGVMGPSVYRAVFSAAGAQIFSLYIFNLFCYLLQ